MTTKTIATKNRMYLLLFPLFFFLNQFSDNASRWSEAIILWAVSTIILTVIFGLTIIHRRIEYNDKKITIVYLLRKKSIEISDIKYIEDKPAALEFKSINGSLLLSISKTSLLKDDFKGLLEYIESVVES